MRSAEPPVVDPGTIPPRAADPEPDRRPPPAPILAGTLLARALVVTLLAVALLPLWLPFAIGLALYGYPPTVPRPARIRRFIGWIATRRPDEPPIPLLVRAWLLLTVLRKAAAIPLWGSAWMLDELLYGRALDRTPVEAPLFHMSAGRSGSTRMTRVLEADPGLVAPNLLQTALPYLWLWRLARRLGGGIDRERLRRVVAARLDPAFLERHEGDLFAAETFDAVLFGMHLNGLSIFLGPRVMAAEFAMGSAGPSTRRLWSETTPLLIDRLARKTLRFAGPMADGRPRRFLLKGHFLAAADPLAARFPDARFLTVIRDPARRLRSLINFIRVNPAEPVLGWPPWATVAPALARTEIDYCLREQAWFTRPDGPARCAVAFTDFIADLEGTLRTVYRDCFDGAQPPAALPRAHPPREARSYRVDRSLDALGIHPEGWAEPLTDYRVWSGSLRSTAALE